MSAITISYGNCNKLDFVNCDKSVLLLLCVCSTRSDKFERHVILYHFNSTAKGAM